MKPHTCGCCAVALIVSCATPGRGEIATLRLGTPPAGRAAKPVEAPRPGRPAAYVPEADRAPVVDGDLADAAWRGACVLGLERTLDGEGRAPQPTEVRLLRAGGSLYVGVRCTESLVGKLRFQRREHDGSVWSDDSIEIFVGSGRGYYHFGVNAAGSTYDARARDASWDSGVAAAAARGKGEWTVELSIPLDKMSGEKMSGEGKILERWTANFNRNRYTTGAFEESAWSPTLSGDSHVPARFGRLVFGGPPPEARGGEPPRPAGRPSRKRGAEVLPCEGGECVIRFDLAPLPKGARIHRADLRLFRTGELTGCDDEALIDIEILPLFAEFTRGEPKELGDGLRLRPPWFDRFDATDAVHGWARGRPNGGFFVKTCPRMDPEATFLDITYTGEPQDVPPQVEGLEVFHRAGQTFIVFREIDDRSADPSPLWAELEKRLDEMDAARHVRYLVFRQSVPIDAATLARAELLAEVEPMSGYNVIGRSVDELIRLHRKRAVDDLAFAKRLAKRNYFTDYNPDMPEMGEVAIRRLAVEDGKPLPPRTGLYVRQPREPGDAYYAVISCVEGVANTRDFSRANSLSRPVAETAGPGEPVLQGRADVAVFFDYPGERLHYVQWTAPPLSNLPNQYCSWGVFVPKGYREADVKRLGVFFHGGKQRHLKPPWPHRRDTVLLSPHDAPFRSYGYGYHEALGTLRSFRQGRVRPFFARRVDAMLDWAAKRYAPDPGRVSCGGHGPWGGTAALQYALQYAPRRPGRIAYVMADGSPDPDPRETPHRYKHYGRRNERSRATHRAAMEAVWGKVEWGEVEWGVRAESGRSIWEEADLPALVRADPTRTMPFMTLGAGAMHVTWKQEADLMKAYLATGNAFMSEFFWGGRAFTPLPVDAQAGDYPFEPRSDRPILGTRPLAHHPNPAFFEPGGQFDAGRRGYGAGSRLCNRPRWDAEDVVDTEDRLEMTIFSAKKVTYAGAADYDVTVRNAQRFGPAAGERVAWRVIDTKSGGKLQEGEVTVGANGLAVLPGVRFARPARLILERGGEE